MFTITNTRIVGLIAVVGAFVLAPQALAATSTQSRIFLPGDASDLIQRSDLRGELSDQGIASATFAAGPWQSPLGQPANNTPAGIDLTGLKNGYHRLAGIAAAPHKNLKGSTAAIEALQRRSVALDAVYRKLYSGLYGHAIQKKSAALPAPALPVTAPVVCNGQADYEYVYSGCNG